MGIYSNCCNDLGFVLQGQSLTFVVSARDGVCNGCVFSLLWLSWLSVFQKQGMEFAISIAFRFLQH